MNENEIITQHQAAALGRKRFYTGKPCKYKHDTERYVSTGGCIACAEDNKRSRRFVHGDDGITPVTVWLHEKDKAALREFIEALNTARGLMVKQ